MPYAMNERVRIHYETEGSGAPLVLQHGFTNSLETWAEDGYVEPLAQRFRIILIDARGHGGSDKPHDPGDYSASHMAADVTSVLDALAIDKAHFFGYSLGGSVGLYLAQHAPHRSSLARYRGRRRRHAS
jgi:pimeloyl-ACP methyl ester carboxylesterase